MEKEITVMDRETVMDKEIKPKGKWPEPWRPEGPEGEGFTSHGEARPVTMLGTQQAAPPLIGDAPTELPDAVTVAYVDYKFRLFTAVQHRRNDRMVQELSKALEMERSENNRLRLQLNEARAARAQ
jgi:hypothetical protein